MSHRGFLLQKTGRRSGNGLGCVEGHQRPIRVSLVLEVPAQAPGKLGSESGDRRPVGVGPPLGLWLPMALWTPGHTMARWSPPLPQPTAQLLQWGPSDPVTMATSLQLEQRS